MKTNESKKEDKKSICEKHMNTYLMLDKNERLPLSLTIHLLGCKECRRQVKLLTMAERVAAEPLKIDFPFSAANITNAVKKHYFGWLPEVKPVSMTKWVVGGILMIIFMLAFGIFTRNSQDENLILAFYLVFAGAVTAYCAFFVAINLDYFVKGIKKFQLSL